MTKRNPVKYAENELGVHVPWEEAQDRLAAYSQASDDVQKFKSLLRDAKDRLEDLKREARSDAVTEIEFYDSMSVKEREQAVRDFIANRPTIASVEHDIRAHQANLDIAESDVRYNELGLKVLSSRMAELGGLLHFYAEVKHAETQVDKSNTSVGLSTTQETGETN